jgi:hypothetical protein
MSEVTRRIPPTPVLLSPIRTTAIPARTSTRAAMRPSSVLSHAAETTSLHKLTALTPPGRSFHRAAVSEMHETVEHLTWTPAVSVVKHVRGEQLFELPGFVRRGRDHFAALNVPWSPAQLCSAMSTVLSE